MIFIVAGNLRQADLCASKNRLAPDLWQHCTGTNALISYFNKETDLVWLTGSYTWLDQYASISSLLNSNNIVPINKDK